MSMICFNPLTCVSWFLLKDYLVYRMNLPFLILFSFQSFMDLQFSNGQFTYVAGEGLTSSAFLPIFGGLLQAQGQCPGETKFSFSYKVSSW